MDETNIELKLNDHEHEIGSLKHRMKAVEENQKALNSLATSVAVVAEKTDAISNNANNSYGVAPACKIYKDAV